MIRVPHVAKISSSYIKDGRMIVDVTAVPATTLEAIVSTALNCYFRWVATGKPEKTYYWDRYHDSIEPTENPDVFAFNVQLEDGPDGDSWVRGTVDASGSWAVILTKEHYVT